MLNPVDRELTPPQIGPETFFITVTLKPKLYKFTAHTQYQITTYDMDKCIYQSDDYILVPECTKDGNIHYHAIVSFRNALQRISFIDSVKKNKTLGFIKLTPKPLDNKESFDRAYNYLLKDVHTTTKLVHTANYTPPIITDKYMNNNVFIK